MDILGQLVWWSIGNPDLSPAQVGEIMSMLGVLGASPPNQVIPIDAFRRLTGGQRLTYDLDDTQVTLDLHRAEGRSTILTRHIVRTVTRKGVRVGTSKVGEAAFLRPPKGQPFKGRMKVVVYPDDVPDRAEIEQFAADLRTEYAKALDYLDPQALRRMVRQYLAHVQAVYLGGPYFIPELGDAIRLQALVRQLGGGSQCHVVPMPNDEERRHIVRDALAATAANGDVPTTMIETYAPLDVVPEEVWDLLKKEGQSVPK